ncbi:MAG: hypothetical protein QNL62_08495 [Gammaproteobacteria bacterium]|nr:hypothetical protein [Gammaproteobacteria bacterium]
MNSFITKKAIIVIGIGEMSGVFTRGLLRAGYPLIPVTRDMDINEVARQVEDPEMVLVAVGESDLDPLLEQIPLQWKNKVALLQNELLPRDWQRHQLVNPTVISVWFEKKKGQDFKVLVSSPIMGPKAEIIKTALAQIGIPSWIVKNDSEMLFELVRKNLYILTTNIAGMEVGGDVNSLWNIHRELALKVFDDVLTIQNHLTRQKHQLKHELKQELEQEQDRERLIEAMVEAINGDLAHQCMGRSAPARLARALDYAKENHLQVKELERIASRK